MAEEASSRRVLLLLVLTTVFIDSFALSMVIPLLAFLGREFSASAQQVSYLFAAFAIAQFFSAMIGGRLSDRFGRRPLLLLSLVGSVCSSSLYFSRTTYIHNLTISRNFAFNVFYFCFLTRAVCCQISPISNRNPKNIRKVLHLEHWLKVLLQITNGF